MVGLKSKQVISILWLRLFTFPAPPFPLWDFWAEPTGVLGA